MTIHQRTVGIDVSKDRLDIYDGSASSCGNTVEAIAPLARAGSEGRAAGASSRTTCALVPLMPNALTPAIRRPSVAGQGRVSRGTSKGSRLQGMWGLGVR